MIDSPGIRTLAAAMSWLGEVLIVAPDGENVILVSIDQWWRLEWRTASDIKELLLAREARTEMLTPPRTMQRRRSTSRFE